MKRVKRSGERITHLVHRLLGGAFIPNPDNHPVVRHLNDVPSDNRLENLAWGTRSDNLHERKTAKQLWEEAEEGTTFACQFITTGGAPVEDEPEVVWTKGVVDDLGWSEVLWIQAIEYVGERVYR